MGKKGVTEKSVIVASPIVVTTIGGLFSLLMLLILLILLFLSKRVGVNDPCAIVKNMCMQEKGIGDNNQHLGQQE
ncbi:MAG: hypothetical protein R6U46_04330 [Marinilabilia sp.]